MVGDKAQFFVKNIDFYDENLPEWQRDVEGAKELLKEANFDFDSEIKINLKPQERRIGYLFQNYALYPHLTVKKNILFVQHLNLSPIRHMMYLR